MDEIIDIIYYVTDLDNENNTKILLEDETKTGLVTLISEHFKKPLFRLFVRADERELLEDKLKKFRIFEFNNDETFKMGDFLLRMEEAGEL